MVHVLEEVRRRGEPEPTVILLDELTFAGHSIQATALRWVNTAMIDRLMHHGEAVVTQGGSYRLKNKPTE